MRHLSNKFGPAIAAIFLMLGIGAAFNVTVQAQRRPYRMTDRQIENIIRRIEVNTNRFQASIDSSLDRSRRDGTRAEDNINAFVQNFENATDQLRQRFNSRQSVAADVENVLRQAAVIDTFMSRRRAVAGAQDEWALVKTDLNALASAYGVNWRWDTRANVPFEPGTNTGRGRNWDRYENFGGSFDLRQTALNAGYNRGIEVGRDDRSRNRASDYRNSSDYQRATTDYSSRLGDRELYRRYYRAGFENGYNDGYGTQVGGTNWPNPVNPINNRDPRGRNWDRYGTYGGSFQLRQTALNAGYNEGIKLGREDRSRNRNSDFRSANAYQEATKDYSSRLGDRELYRRYYREGFENGYNDGYNGN
ncbi:MAG TPA: hypothetical protein VNO50_11955 [Pyrinomonadaceae bacterium]|nr:hypothetical protein [Pyrinomonadaceae bacterium]